MKSFLNFSKPVFLALIFIVYGCTWEQLSPEVDCNLSPIQGQVLNVNNTLCGEDNGSFALSVSGGEGPFTFSTNGVTNNDGVFEDVAAGTYTVLISDASDCTAQINVSVQNEQGVNFDSLVATEAGCDTSNGTIEVTATGGAAPYQYSLNGGQLQSDNRFTQLGSGSYTVSVTDQTGCETTQEIEVLSGISFSNTISGIIQANCATSGCHNGSIFPDLRNISNIQASASRIRSRTANRSMPPNTSLSQEHIDQIACWVNDGALDN